MHMDANIAILDFQWEDKIEWFAYGTGGRRMKVMSKVIAWMELPEKYEGE